MAHMIEFWDYLVQFLVCAAGCTGAAALLVKSRRQPYFLLACFFGTYGLGTLYWTLHVLLLDVTPRIFYVSELGWIASYVFLLTMEMTLPSAEELRFRTKLSWLAPAIGVPQFILYITYGDVFFNVLMCSGTMAAAWLSIRGLVFSRRSSVLQAGGEARGKDDADFASGTTAPVVQPADLRPFHITVLCFTGLEYALWTSSCFWVSDTLSNPYFWFDSMLSAAIFMMLPATRKAVGQ